MTSTKPYLYFERIMNGIVSVPESVQKKLSNVLLVRRQELEKPKSIVEPKPEEKPSLLESWFSTKPVQQSESEPTKPVEQSDSWFSTKPVEQSEAEPTKPVEQSNSWFATKPAPVEQSDLKPAEPTKPVEPAEPSDSWFATKQFDSWFATKPVFEKKCNIRGW